ncbi:cyanobactin biosynthesis system PatB/AcyB/McaB family protein [Amycolatopsis lurida]
MPKLAPPVRRPELIQPHRVVEISRGSTDRLIAMRMRLMHGANFNDPQAFAYPSHERMRVSAR